MGIIFGRPAAPTKRGSTDFSGLDSPSYSRLDSESRKREEEARRCQEWADEVLPYWDQHVSPRGKKLSRRIRALSKMGIPPGMRGRVWSKAIGNSLHITRELYDIFYQHAKEARHLTTAALTEGEADGKKFLGKEHSMQLIETDLPRTFAGVKFFSENVDQLREILQTYACYRPDVGYVQGMSYLAGMMLYNMDCYSAFVALANLLNYHYFLTFFRMDMAQMRKYFAVFDALFADQLPALQKHFRALEIQPEMYLVDWLLTLFSKALPFEMACHVWDCYVLEGETFMYRAALGVLKYLDDEKKMRKMEFEEVLPCLNKLSEQELREGDVFEAIFGISVSRSTVEKLMEKNGLSALRA
eukprot:tig00021127_g18693.t1